MPEPKRLCQKNVVCPHCMSLKECLDLKKCLWQTFLIGKVPLTLEQV